MFLWYAAMRRRCQLPKGEVCHCDDRDGGTQTWSCESTTCPDGAAPDVDENGCPIADFGVDNDAAYPYGNAIGVSGNACSDPLLICSY